VLSVSGSAEQLAVADCFMPRAAGAWLQPESLPALTLPVWQAGRDLADAHLVSSEVPVLFGRPIAGERLLEIKRGRIRLGLDVPGSIFFLLTRYEELVHTRRDRHDRFPAIASLALRAGFLHRPLANEYLEILWACLTRLWPGLVRRRRSYTVALSHDVDRPFGQGWSRLVRCVGADVVLRREPGLAVRRIASRLRRGERRRGTDPDNTFALILDTSERRGLKSTFYFMAGRTDHRYDGDYSLDAPWIQALLREIHDRGHEIGLHPSYHTWRDAAQLSGELNRLRLAAERLRIRQNEWGGRQHYLRFRAPETWRHYETAGLAFDATLTFADRAGFRCSTCYEFTPFDLEERRPLRLREHPLTVMDGTLLDASYMGLSPDRAREAIKSLAQTCRSFAGTFSLLWHNSQLATAWQRRLYADVVEGIRS
jgi:peptidoglycan/xylan/chitin deacetylase (PgdA/CDA1 family)